LYCLVEVMALVVKQEVGSSGENMKKRASALGDIAALFLCDASDGAASFG